MTTYDHLDEETLDSRVRLLRPAIEYCFKKSDVVTKLAQHGLLNAEETARLIEVYDQKPSQDASSEMFNILFKKRVPTRKWKIFVDAIKEAGYDFAVSRLISERVEIPEERERGKTLLLQFGPFLERDINPLLLITRLLASSVIKEEDADKIENTTQTKSKAEGMRILLQRIQCYLEPHNLWEKFLTVLWETEFEHMALLLEPEYFPTSKKLGPIDAPDVVTGPADMQEYVMEDKVDAEPDNDLNAPPVPARSYSLGAFEDDESSFSGQDTRAMTSIADDMQALNENFKGINIKPERNKSVDDVAHQSDEDSVDSNEWDSENGGSDFEENDDNQEGFENKEILYTREATGALTKELNKRNKRTYEPRDYQLELAEKALCGQNTIICAETGTGKTWVALYVIDKHLSQASKSPKKVAFMARTGVLIKQQSNRFKKYLPQYNTKLITGDDEDSRMVDAFIPTNDIICFTPQILVNSLDSGNISSLSKFSLLVFDECHHTRGDEPYARLARKYLVEKANGQKELPQIVGLTASIGVGKSRTVEEAVDYIIRVCASLDVRPPLSTVERCRESFKKWVNTPEEETIKMMVKNPDPCKDILLEAMEDAEKLLEGRKPFLCSFNKCAIRIN
ncbi:hypothetical protein DPMN_067597 [Dreissena polymorpha]|uniref:Helicase ATP-binding domain-containing protein n=1 Tax=Dreissena polymorpha TaxID=45954 RepID=A0A9D3YVJ1_DREPO|nr:hypothetical protein DPMN_067597 [Dreissena polymorpha]